MSNTLDVDKNLNYITAAIPQEESSGPHTEDRIRKIGIVWNEKVSKGYRSSLLIKHAPPKGLGVFADKAYKKNEELEYCHCAMSIWKGNYISEPSYRQYAYWESCKCQDCRTHGKRGAFVLGAGSIVNSASTSDEANVVMEIYGRYRLAIIRATKDIKAGEELLAWHGEDYFNSWCRPKTSTPSKAIKKSNSDQKARLNSIQV